MAPAGLALAAFADDVDDFLGGQAQVDAFYVEGGVL